jgi:hypothetical protein
MMTTGPLEWYNIVSFILPGVRSTALSKVLPDLGRTRGGADAMFILVNYYDIFFTHGFSFHLGRAKKRNQQKKGKEKKEKRKKKKDLPIK